MSKTIEEVRYKLQDLDCGHDECIMASYSDGRKDAIQEMNKRIDNMIVYYNKSDSAKYILNELKKSLKEDVLHEGFSKGFKGEKE